MDYEKYKKDIISSIMEQIEEIVTKEVEATVDDLKWEAEHWKEQYKDLEDDLNENYIARPRSDYTGDSYDDRF